MIDAETLLKFFLKKKISFYSGVPDSVLKNFTKLIDKKKLQHIKAANEGSAVSVAIGEYLSSGKLPCVYLQNSGLGNAINPLISIAHKQVYNIPLLLLIGWRGDPSLEKKDEPQHRLKGEITPNLLKLLDINYVILNSENNLKKISKIIDDSRKKNKISAILVKMNSITSNKKKVKKKIKIDKGMKRIFFIEKLIQKIPKNYKIVSTTGYTSRELDYLRKKYNKNSNSDLYMVGGMGHSAMVSLGISFKKKVICLDGDGSILMHLGSMRTVGFYGNKNFKHIILNNGCHESVGGQITTVTGTDFKNLSKSLGYKSYFSLSLDKNTNKTINLFLKSNGPSLLEVKISSGSIDELTRPKEFLKIKKNFMKKINA